MFRNIFKKIFGTPAIEKTSSEFSRFFRKASSREKKKVFMEVARKASAEQKAVIQSARLVHQS